MKKEKYWYLVCSEKERKKMLWRDKKGNIIIPKEYLDEVGEMNLLIYLSNFNKK